MRIYSWNMHFRNPELDRAFDFIAHADFDIFCLQEVPPQFLERLQTLRHNIVFALDTDRIERDIERKNFCVILSPHPIIASASIEFPVEARRFRTTLFQLVMWGLKKIDMRGSLFADIDFPNGQIRIFDLHLTLSYPERILREFDSAMTHRLPAQAGDERVPTIVCGDFNILESPHITILNWLLGGRIRDAFAWRSSRKHFQQHFAKLGLKNPLRGNKTQKIALSQLDHILVPNDFRISEAKVFADRLGSDHTPVFVEC